MKEFQLGVGMIGLGAGLHKGQACLVIKEAYRQGEIGATVAPGDQGNFSSEGALILLGNRKAAKVMLRHLRAAIDLLPK